MDATQAAEPLLVLSRVLDAPRDLVFRSIAEPERFMQWWGPRGFTLEFRTVDVRPGGMLHYRQTSPDGQVMWGKFVYRTIMAPERIEFVNSFADPEGNTVQAPFHADWPLEILNVWTLTEEGGKTTLTLYGQPINATEASLQLFAQSAPMLEKGFGGTFQNLEDYLSSIQP